MKTINLKNILEKDVELIEDISDGKLSYNFVVGFIENWMREACNQAINLCAESAEAGYKYCGKDPDVEPYVLKNSILDVKKQIV